MRRALTATNLANLIYEACLDREWEKWMRNYFRQFGCEVLEFKCRIPEEPGEITEVELALKCPEHAERSILSEFREIARGVLDRTGDQFTLRLKTLGVEVTARVDCVFEGVMRGVTFETDDTRRIARL